MTNDATQPPRKESNWALESLRVWMFNDDYRMEEYFDWIVKTLPGPTASQKLAMVYAEKLERS